MFPGSRQKLAIECSSVSDKQFSSEEVIIFPLPYWNMLLIICLEYARGDGVKSQKGSYHFLEASASCEILFQVRVFSYLEGQTSLFYSPRAFTESGSSRLLSIFTQMFLSKNVKVPELLYHSPYLSNKDLLDQAGVGGGRGKLNKCCNFASLTSLVLSLALGPVAHQLQEMRD